MLSPADFKEKQILLIRTDRQVENKIKFRNDNIVYLKDKKITDQMSCHKALAIFIVGEISITSILIKNCVNYGISIFLMNYNFRVYATIGSQAEGNYLLRAKQYGYGSELEFSKHIVLNKITNQSSLLGKNAEAEELSELGSAKVKQAKGNQELLGIEGYSTKIFFKSYFRELDWYKRMPRTKVDIYNVLLDIGYTFLFNYIDSLLRLYGFDTYRGFYHKLFFQRKSLTCDIMEPFRCIIEKQLLKSFHLNQIDKNDFEFSNGRFFLKFDKNQKYTIIFLEAILGYKEEIFLYVKSFYKCVFNDLVDYPIFKIK